MRAVKSPGLFCRLFHPFLYWHITRLRGSVFCACGKCQTCWVKRT